MVAIIRTFVRGMGSTVVTKGRIFLQNFNDFVVGRETRGITHGVSGGAAVIVPTRSVPTFGPTGMFLGTMGRKGWEAYGDFVLFYEFMSVDSLEKVGFLIWGVVRGYCSWEVRD